MFNQFGDLTTLDIKKLADRWITEEIAEQAQLRRVTSGEGASIVARNGSGDYSGIVIPYFWPGEIHPREYRLRRDHPDLEQTSDGEVKEKAKYLSPPGRSSLLYLVPGMLPELLSDTSVPLVYVEGEFKCLALHRLSLWNVEDNRPRFLPVGLPGVWNWRGTVGKTTGPNGERRDLKGVIGDIDRIPHEGREIFICFDANVFTNENVKAARRGLTKELIRRKGQVRYVDLPRLDTINGVDDLLTINGPEFVLDLFINAKHADVTVPSGFRLSESGVYAVDSTGNAEDIFICSRMVISAATRNKDGESWGRLLEFEDLDGVPHSWAMAMEMLSGEGSEYRARLLSMGLTIAPNKKSRELLTTYIQTAKPDDRVRCVDRIGWFESVFVLPDETFGNWGNERVLFQSTGNQHSLRVSGSLEDWRENITRNCQGNSRLVFAVSCAFAGPLLPLANEGGGGFHLRGLTSTGKTTAQRVGGSAWGGDSTNKGYLEPWRTTINGLEAVAELHNNGLLCLDEIDQCDPREVGEIAYMLANGIGKSRMTRNIGARKKLTWDLIFLSSGERSLSDLALSVGKKTRGGQEVRMCDLEADAGKGLGMFECLHDFSSPAEMAGFLSSASRKYYGAAIRAYLQQLAINYDEATNAVKHFMKMFITKYVPKDSAGEVVRVAIRFAIVAAAGELAQEITGWPEGEAMEAAATMFNVWMAGRGTKGSSDVEQAIRQVKGFLEAHGSSRFQLEGQEDAKVINRVGFKKIDEDGNTRYLILTESFRKEVCAGYDPKIIAKELANRGYLIPGDGRNLARREKIEGFNRPRVYVLTSALLEE
jgi:uncharacterized protein (DUF927 family)